VMLAASVCGVELDPRAPEWNYAPTRAMGAYRPSMLVDFERKRPVELDPIVAEPLRRGISRGAKLPGMVELLDGIRRVLAANGVEDGPSVSA
jgi:ketopantoate reductase